MKLMIAKIIFGFFFLLQTSDVHACIVYKELDWGYLENADYTFKGKVIGYTPGKITFALSESYRGAFDAEDGTLTVQWGNSTFGIPKSLEDFKRKFGRELYVAAIRGDKLNISESKGRDIYILQEACSSPFMFSLTSDSGAFNPLERQYNQEDLYSILKENGFFNH